MKNQQPASPICPAGSEFIRTHTPMKPIKLSVKISSQKQSFKFIAAAVLGMTCLAPCVFGASQTWTNAPVNQVWTNELNWVGGAAPGATNSAATTDTATFNEPIS